MLEPEINSLKISLIHFRRSSHNVATFNVCTRFQFQLELLKRSTFDLIGRIKKLKNATIRFSISYQ